jgi:choline dehydrogenase-like flavoprotein
MATDSGKRFLSARQRRTVEAFADVFIEGDREALTPAEVADRIDRQLAERSHSKRTRSLRLVLWGIEYVFPLASLRLRPFSRLSAPARRDLIDKHLARAKSGSPLRNLAKLRALFLAGYYDDPAAHESIGYVEVADRARNHGVEPAVFSRPPVALGEPDPDCVYDLCVIGSGAGGSVIARHAAAENRKVLLLEEGGLYHPQDITKSEADMTARLYKEGGLQTTVDLGMSILQGRAVGGTTFVNNAICFRLDDDPTRMNPSAPDVLAEWERLGAQVDRAALSKAYDNVERKLGVAQITDRVAGPNGSVFLEGWHELVRAGRADKSWPAQLFRKNFDECAACGYCNWGCAYGRRRAPLETYLPEAVAYGATIAAGYHADAIELDGDEARRVHWSRNGASGSVRTRAVVVAAGAIGSSVLLLNSGITRNVGSRFSFNVGTPVMARFPWAVDAFDGDQMAAYVDSGSYLLESSIQPPVGSAISMPGWFREHFDRMRDFSSLAALGVLIPSRPSGRVKRLSLWRDLFGPVAWSMADADLDVMRAGRAMAAQLYFAAGADAVYPSTYGDHQLRRENFVRNGHSDAAAILAEIERAAPRSQDLTLNSSHPQGGNPMSDRPELGVVGSDFRVHDTRNVYVCDASVFPTSIRINPQETVMAFADYAWETSLAERLPAGV